MTEKQALTLFHVNGSTDIFTQLFQSLDSVVLFVTDHK